jgi:hypothetical protein
MDSANAGEYPQENEIIGYFVGVVHDVGFFRKYVHVLNLGTAFLVCAAQLNERLCRPLSYDVL